MTDSIPNLATLDEYLNLRVKPKITRKHPTPYETHEVRSDFMKRKPAKFST